MRPCRREGYRLERLGSEILLYHPDETTVVYCNETAALVWDLCDGQRTVAEIVALLTDTYPESADRVKEDVTVTIERLQASRALVC